MLVSDGITESNSTAATTGGPDTSAGKMKSLLECAFDVRFAILDAAGGDVLESSPAEPSRDWGRCSELCREAARRGRPEFIDDDDPLLTLALPCLDAEGSGTVAVATFLTRPVAEDEDFSGPALRLGMEPGELRKWASRQKPWSAETLKQITGLVLDNAQAEMRLRALQEEAEKLSGNLASTYEEIGAVEANLLSSVAAILGVHGGNIELYRQQAELLEKIIHSLSSAIDAKDPYTCGHSDRVARVAVRLAEEMGCDAEMLKTIYLAGLLHDVGKIGVEDCILHKAGKLSDEEYKHIKQHAEIGHRILHDLSKLEDVLPVVLHHHESWDGNGYPRQLDAERIPLAARIVAVADAFDAMSSDRPYRKRMPDERVDEILRAGAGRQWDPAVIDAFFRSSDDLRRLCREAQENAGTHLV